MSIWNKVLLGLLAIASLVFFHAAVRTVKTFDYWSKQTDKFQRRLNEVRADIVQLQTADHEHPLPNKTFGVQQLRVDVARMVNNRGRIWANCQMKKVQPEVVNGAKTGRTEVNVSSDEPGVSGKMLLYVFEEGDEPNSIKYLGEFAVKASNSPNDFALLSTTQLTKLQENNLAHSKSPWVLYEMMPADQHLMRGEKPDLVAKNPAVKDELIATLPDDLRKKFFPDPDPGLSKAEQDKWKKEKWWLPEEYVLDGQVVNGAEFERKLRDYLEVMRVCEVDRTLYDDRKNALERDETYLTAAKTDSDQQLVFADRQKAQATAERKWEYKQRDATAAFYADLQRMLSFNDAAVKAAIAANAEAAKQIAKIQKEAAEEIDRRTRSMARAGSTGSN
jgi:hypothetical protein